MRANLFIILLLALFASSCTKQPETAAGAGAQRASITLRDGSVVAGTVLPSQPGEMRIAGDDQITRTVPMANVKTVEYGDAPAAAAPAPSAPASTPVAPAPPRREAAPDPVHDRHEHPPETAVTTKTYALPSGTEVSVRNEETIDSAKAVEGQTFAAEVTRDVRDQDGAVVIPRGANAQIVIRSASKGGRIRGAPDLVLDLKSVSIDGRQYTLSTQEIVKKGREGVGINKRTGEFAGAGAAVGAIIGAIAGHGKGAAIGAGAGAGAGTLTEIITKGGSVKVPVESVLTFRLDQPLSVTASK